MAIWTDEQHRDLLFNRSLKTSLSVVKHRSKSCSALTPYKVEEAMSFVEAYQVGSLRWKRDERTLEFGDRPVVQSNLDNALESSSPLLLAQRLNGSASDGT